MNRRLLPLLYDVLGAGLFLGSVGLFVRLAVAA